MISIVYEPQSTAEVFDLSGRSGLGLDLGDLANWEFERSKSVWSSLYQKEQALKTTLSCTYRAATTLDRLLDATDIDCSLGIPGTLRYNGWSLECFIQSGTRTHTSYEGVQYDIEFLAPSPTWFKEYIFHFVPRKGVTIRGGHDFKHDYAHDYAAPPPPVSITVPTLKSCSCRLVIFGKCSRPSVTIGKNRYQVNCEVASGGYLVIDGTKNNLGCTLYHPDGASEDVFALAQRGTGVGSGSYIFERIAKGVNPVSWDNTFSFDVVVRDERSRLPWRMS